MVSITGLAHEIIRSVLRPGDWALDGTAGNGHDTLFLARQVGPRGTVWAIDVQPVALKSTQQRLIQHRCHNVQLLLGNHANLEQLLPERLRGILGAAMFNLGYLPHQDHRLTTLRDTTRPALQGAIRMLRPGGVLTVVAYRGHPGGEEEATAVDEWMQGFSAAVDNPISKWVAGPFRFPVTRPSRGPQLLALKKLLQT